MTNQEGRCCLPRLLLLPVYTAPQLGAARCPAPSLHSGGSNVSRDGEKAGPPFGARWGGTDGIEACCWEQSGSQAEKVTSEEEGRIKGGIRRRIVVRKQ